MTRTLITHFKANAVAYVALFIALGGTSYAAVRLPANSVGTKQLKSSAVTSSKVRNNSLRAQDFAPGALKRGPRGPEGPAGTAGAPGAVAGTLPSGKTLRGRFEAGSGTSGNAVGNVVSESISFGAQLAAAPTATIIADNAASPPQCPGTAVDPQALPGNLCIFVGEAVGISGIQTILDDGVTGQSARHGVGIFVASSVAGTFGARGSWAVTAP